MRHAMRHTRSHAKTATWRHSWSAIRRHPRRRVHVWRRPSLVVHRRRRWCTMGRSVGMTVTETLVVVAEALVAVAVRRWVRLAVRSSAGQLRIGRPVWWTSRIQDLAWLRRGATVLRMRPRLWRECPRSKWRRSAPRVLGRCIHRTVVVHYRSCYGGRRTSPTISPSSRRRPRSCRSRWAAAPRQGRRRRRQRTGRPTQLLAGNGRGTTADSRYPLLTRHGRSPAVSLHWHISAAAEGCRAASVGWHYLHWHVDNWRATAGWRANRLD